MVYSKRRKNLGGGHKKRSNRKSYKSVRLHYYKNRCNIEGGASGSITQDDDEIYKIERKIDLNNDELNKLKRPSGMIRPVDNPGQYKNKLDDLKGKLAKMKPNVSIISSQSSPSWLEIVNSDNIVNLRKHMSNIQEAIQMAEKDAYNTSRGYKLGTRELIKLIEELKTSLGEIKTSLDTLYTITYEIILPIKRRFEDKKITREKLLEIIEKTLIDKKCMDTIEPTNKKLLDDITKAYTLVVKIKTSTYYT